MKRFIFFIFPFFFILLTLSANEPPAELTRNTFVSKSKEFLGVPYVWGGTTKKGVDCSGFIYTSAKTSVGISLPRTSAAMYSFADAIADIEREPGDLLFFKTDTGNKITHVAIYLGDNKFIHAASGGTKTGVIISSLTENYWRKAYASAGQIIPSAKLAVQAAETETIDNKPLISTATVAAVVESAKVAETTSLPEAIAVSVTTKENDTVKAATTAATQIGTTKAPEVAKAVTSTATQVTTTIANKIDVSQLTAAQKRALFVQACLQAQGLPFKANGTSSSGVDAIGLIYAVARDVFGSTKFPRTIDALYASATKIPETQAEVGDILFFVQDGNIADAGVYLGSSKFIHATDEGDVTGVVISNINDAPWNSTYAGIGQIFAPTKVSATKPQNSTAINQYTPQQKRNLFISSAQKVIGTKYKVGGTTKEGVDDIGLIFAIGRDAFATVLPNTITNLYNAANKISEKDAAPGDIIFFAKNGLIYHAGIYIGNSKFIHATNEGGQSGVVESSLKDEPWKSSYNGIAQIFASVK